MSAMGLGVMPLCISYPKQRPSMEQAIAVIHAALEVGVRFFDTADAYCHDQKDFHYGESLVRRAVASYMDGSLLDSIVIATKGGMTRINSEANGWRNFVSPNILVLIYFRIPCNLSIFIYLKLRTKRFHSRLKHSGAS